MNLYKAAFKEEIHEILKMLKFGLRFLNGKGVQSLGKLLQSQMEHTRRLPPQRRIPKDHGQAHRSRG